MAFDPTSIPEMPLSPAKSAPAATAAIAPTPEPTSYAAHPEIPEMQLAPPRNGTGSNTGDQQTKEEGFWHSLGGAASDVMQGIGAEVEGPRTSLLGQEVQQHGVEEGIQRTRNAMSNTALLESLPLQSVPGIAVKTAPMLFRGSWIGRTAWSALTNAAMMGAAGEIRGGNVEGAGGAIAGAVLGGGFHSILGEAVPAGWKYISGFTKEAAPTATLKAFGNAPEQLLTNLSPDVVKLQAARNTVVRTAMKAGLTLGEGSDVMPDMDSIDKVRADFLIGGNKPIEDLTPDELLTTSRAIRYLSETSEKIPRTAQEALDYEARGGQRLTDLAQTEPFYGRGISNMQQAIASTASEMLGPNPALQSRGLVFARNVMSAFVSSFGRWADQFGPAGKFISQKLTNAQFDATKYAAPWVKSITDLTQSMTKGELINASDAIQGLDTPMNDAVGKLVDTWKQVSEAVATKAREAGVMVRDGNEWHEFRPKDFYFPRMYTRESIEGLSAADQQELFTAASEATGKQITNAKSFLNETYRSRSALAKPGDGLANIISGNLQRHRWMDLPGYETDVSKVLPIYLMKAGRAIAATEQFGPKFSVLDGMLQNIHTATGSDFIQNQFINNAGKMIGRYGDPGWNDLYNITSAVELLSKVSFPATLKHFPAQTLNLMIKTGIAKPLGAALGLAQKNPDLMDFAGRVGANTRNLIPELTEGPEDIPGGELAQKFKTARDWYTNKIGLNPLIKYQRSIASVVGADQAEELAQKYVSAFKELGGDSPQVTRLGAQLSDLKINPADVIKKALGDTYTFGGKTVAYNAPEVQFENILNDEQRRTAGLKAAFDTQLMNRISDMPTFAAGDKGRFLSFLHGAAFQQSVFIKREVMAPAIKWIDSRGASGDIRPMVKWLTRTGMMTPFIAGSINATRENFNTPGGAGLAAAGTAVDLTAGPAAGSLLDLTGSGNTQPVIKGVGLAAILERAASDGGLGLWADAIGHIGNAPTPQDRMRQMESFLMGPILGDVADLGGSVAGSIQTGSPVPAAGWAVGHVPIIGNMLRRNLERKSP